MEDAIQMDNNLNETGKFLSKSQFQQEILAGKNRPSIMCGGTGYFCTGYQLAVRYPENSLVKNNPDVSFLLHIHLHFKHVAAAKGITIINLCPCDDQINALLMEIGETDSFRKQEFMARMFKIVLIICVIDHTLQVTFIVPYLKSQTEAVFPFSLGFFDIAFDIGHTLPELNFYLIYFGNSPKNFLSFRWNL